MRVTRGKGGWGQGEEGKVGVNSDERRPELGCKYIIQCTDDVL